MSKYCNVNNLYGWTMSAKLPVNKIEWIENTSQFKEDFLKNYNKGSDERCFLEVDVQYPQKLHEIHNDLPFLPEELVTNLHNKTEYAIHIRNLKQALNHGLTLKKSS